VKIKSHSAVPALVLSICGLLAPALRAQEFRARIQGMVTDPSQAVVVGAAVTLFNVNTGVQTVRQTNETGLYRFDSVDPGSYTLSVVVTGFSKFVQENIQAQALGDITVNAMLKPGGVSESVTVLESPVAVQFNSTSNVLTVDTKLAAELPRFDRNPFKLSLLNPAVQETRRGEMAPYLSWAANSLELGGGTNQKNDLQVDGSPIGVSFKAGYVPNADAVQEVNIQQNSVDAEAGHSAGGTISMTLKSGTNELHGNAFYLGRNPALNAMTDRTTRTNLTNRNNIWGGMAGHRIIRNKLFNFVSYEQQKPLVPGSALATVPTALERQGDFSQSLNTSGGLRTIYDPYSTIFDSATGKVTRTPFPGNKIPLSQQDQLAQRVMNGLYQPNRTPDSITGTNNFADTLKTKWNYLNLSDRVDWYANDKWRVYGRYSTFRTDSMPYAPIMSQSEFFVPLGSARNAWSYSGDALWTLNATTVASFHASRHRFEDDFSSPNAELGSQRLGKYWPNSQWYKPFDLPQYPVYFPGVTIGSTTFGRAGLYIQHPEGTSFNAKISQQRGAHFLKAGFDMRRSGGPALSNKGWWTFNFGPALTADTFLSPNTRLSGNEFATFLIGALDNATSASVKPEKRTQTESYSGFFQDDYKLSRRLTLNLGLRYEFETPWHDAAHQSSVGLDLTQPIPEMQQNPPKMPAAATSLITAPYSFNGAWVFTDSSNPGPWKSQKTVFMPRVGLALRIDDRTALRFGYARFVAPSELNFVPIPYSALGGNGVNMLEAPYMGFDGTQSVPAPIQGIPQAKFSDPFPAVTNPLIPPQGKGYGRYYGLGESNVVWDNQNFQRLVNDRLNLTFSRQLPNQIVADITYFVNLGRNVAFSRNLNQMDPRIAYAAKGAVDVSVANPFYRYLTPDKFPGSLRNQATVSLRSLLVQYPQYGGLWEAFRSDGFERYQALQIRVQRPFRGGYNFLFGYNYRRERSSQYYDEVANYLDQLGYQDSASSHHSMSVAGTYEFPFGKGRAHLRNMPRVVEGILGGWQTIGAWYFNSGNYLRFGPMIATGDPALGNPTPQQWFDTSKFQRLPAYTPRTNPWQYPDVKGPFYWDAQATLSKTFRIAERVRAEFKAAAYNLTNRLNRADPDTNVLSATFGKTLRQADTTVGRQVEFGLKFVF